MIDINVCLSCDNNYARYAGVVIASILVNAADDERLNFFILDGGSGETSFPLLDFRLKIATVHRGIANAENIRNSSGV